MRIFAIQGTYAVSALWVVNVIIYFAQATPWPSPSILTRHYLPTYPSQAHLTSSNFVQTLQQRSFTMLANYVGVPERSGCSRGDRSQCLERKFGNVALRSLTACSNIGKKLSAYSLTISFVSAKSLLSSCLWKHGQLQLPRT